MSSTGASRILAIFQSRSASDRAAVNRSRNPPKYDFQIGITPGGTARRIGPCVAMSSSVGKGRVIGSPARPSATWSGPAAAAWAPATLAPSARCALYGRGGCSLVSRSSSGIVSPAGPARSRSWAHARSCRRSPFARKGSWQTVQGFPPMLDMNCRRPPCSICRQCLDLM